MRQHHNYLARRIVCAGLISVISSAEKGLQLAAPIGGGPQRKALKIKTDGH
jgi:hypothetical protein